MRRSSPVLPTTSRSPGSCTRSSPRRNLAAPTPPASATSMAFPRSGPGAAPRIAPPRAVLGSRHRGRRDLVHRAPPVRPRLLAAVRLALGRLGGAVVGGSVGGGLV